MKGFKNHFANGQYFSDLLMVFGSIEVSLGESQ